MSWAPGQSVVRRQVVDGRPWLGWMVTVVVDSPDLLATYSPPGSPFDFPAGTWATPSGRHPWEGTYEAWNGCGTLMLQRPDDAYAVWVFWDGPNRDFRCWYLNLEAPLRRTSIGFDTQDHELDLVIKPNGTWEFKDVEMLWQRHHEGRFSRAEVESILGYGDSVAEMVESGDWWWDQAWKDFIPEPSWQLDPLPAGWHAVSTEIGTDSP